jgi:hypothetical protein
VRKVGALLGSNYAGEADTASRKIILLAAKYGLHPCDLIAMAFGQGVAGEVAELQDQLRQQEAQHADQLTEAEGIIQGLRGEVAALSGGVEGESLLEGLKRWLRHAWTLAHFRLLVLTLMFAAGFMADRVFDRHVALLWLYWAALLFVFMAWIIAQCRKRGFGEMLMKCAVYGAVLVIAVWSLSASGADDMTCALGGLAVGLVVTVSRLSEWLCKQVRVKVWESSPAHVMRGWFVAP